MERKKKKEKGGFYIAICCCAVIIAAVGYANRLSLREEAPEEKKIAENALQAEPKATPRVEIPKVSEKEEKAAEKTEEPAPVNKTVQVEEIHFVSPVKGKVIEEFSGDDLVYNEALKDWRAHSGVDLAAEAGEKVLCSAAGVVEEIFDSELGRCVVVDHKNGFKTMYANLSEDTALKIGDEISEGAVIGTIGNTALGDATEEAHLHFEMSRENENVNPAEYLN